MPTQDQKPGTAANPLRVAVIGSGPAGFYVVQHLFQTRNVHVRVDMYERLPAPFGLVRYGVAPDHQNIKAVEAVYDKLARQPNFRYFGNVEFGKDIFLDDLKRYYHQIVFATGAQTDRKMNIPGEDLAGSYAATEFVAWYNGHPDFCDRSFPFDCERAVVIGVGNVAVDVARILCRGVDELARTDIADYALEALANSQIKEVWMVGRRGPAQAAYSPPELKELGELPYADIVVKPEEAELDPISKEELEKSGSRLDHDKVKIVQEYARRPPSGKPKRLVVRFLLSPVELIGDEHGRVQAIRFVRNELYRDEHGNIRPRPTGQYEQIETGLVFRSVGYRGVPLPGLPFDERNAIIPNDGGRVIDPATSEPLVGLYVAGWIKRGPIGVIGTNKPDAKQTVERMLEDLSAGRYFIPQDDSLEAIPRLLETKACRYLTYEDWVRLDAIEKERGKALGRPRVKFVRREEFFEALARAVPVNPD